MNKEKMNQEKLNQEDWELIMEILDEKEDVRSKPGCYFY